MWSPILEGEQASEAWRAIEEIEAALSRPEALTSASSSPGDATLANGTAGVALFFAYLDAARPGSTAGDVALSLLSEAIDALGEARLPVGLYGGFAGIGWVADHLARHFYAADDDLTLAIEEALAELLGRVDEVQPYELIGGLAGYGLALLERRGKGRALELLTALLSHLEKSAERGPEGCAWYHLAEWLPAAQRLLRPNGCYNLGVAHGIPGVLGLLAQARAAGLDHPGLADLADGTVAWLLAHRLPAEEDSAFPALILPGEALEPTRTAWCYGDLGIAAVLALAGRSFARPEWVAEAVSLAGRASQRPPAGVGVVDACLCHGSAGNAHLFNRLYQVSGNPELLVAARHGFGEALASREPGKGVAGFEVWIGDRNDPRRSGEPGFLVGAAGIGLALLAAVSPLEPAWDQLLLASAPA